MDCGRCYDARRDNVRCWGVRVSCSAGCRLGLGVGAFAHRVCSVVDRLRGAWRGLVARETDSAVKGVTLHTLVCFFVFTISPLALRRDAMRPRGEAPRPVAVRTRAPRRQIRRSLWVWVWCYSSSSRSPSQKGNHKSSSASKAKRLAGGGDGAQARAVGVA